MKGGSALRSGWQIREGEVLEMQVLRLRLPQKARQTPLRMTN
jgi:hypothetical protein